MNTPQDIIIIGTVHNLTPTLELEEIIDDSKPDRILIEILPEDLDAGKTDDYSDEMKFVVNHVRSKQIPVFGIDVDIDIEQPGVVPSSEKLYENWKEANKSEVGESILAHATNIDPEKYDKRCSLMAKQIIEKAQGRTLVFTGVGNLPCLAKLLPEASFPLR